MTLPFDIQNSAVTPPVTLKIRQPKRTRRGTSFTEIMLAFPIPKLERLPAGIAAPGDAAKEQLVARKLGIHGGKRWQYFRQHFSGRWGDEGQCPVSPRSQDALLKALEFLNFAPAANASLFLTDDGQLERAWKDAEGRAVQMELGSTEFEIFVEGAGVETHPNSRIGEVTAKLIIAK